MIRRNEDYFDGLHNGMSAIIYIMAKEKQLAKEQAEKEHKLFIKTLMKKQKAWK